MASNHLMESIESMVQCTVCFEIMKEPKMLPCLHRFCLRCLQYSIATLGPVDNFLCPLCRKSIPVPAEGAVSFKTDFMIKQMVEMIMKQKSVEKEEKGGNKGEEEEEEFGQKMKLNDPRLMPIDSQIFPDKSWSVDSVCSSPGTIITVASSPTMNYLIAFTVTGTLCFTSDLFPQVGGKIIPFLTCVAALDDESVVVAFPGRILIVNIASGRSDFERSVETPKNPKPKSIAANSNTIIVHIMAYQQYGVVEKRFHVFDHSLNYLTSVEVDDGDGLVTSISLTEKYFYWVDYYTKNVHFETLDDFTSETGVEKKSFCKPSTYTCAPLSICCDSMDNIYILWRVLGGTDVVIAGGRDCYESCTKIVAQYRMKNPKCIIDQIVVDDKSHRLFILDKNMESEKLVVVTNNNSFYACSYKM